MSVLSPGEPLPEPRKTLDDYSKLEGRYQVLITHPNVFTKQFTGTPQKLTMCVYLNENFMFESWKWAREPEAPVKLHEKTSEAMLLISCAALIVGVDISQIKVGNFLFISEVKLAA